MRINPTYCPETKTWWLGEPIEVEAPTIRELLAKLKELKPRTRWIVQDYYPVGTAAPRPKWKEALKARVHIPPNVREFAP